MSFFHPVCECINWRSPEKLSESAFRHHDGLELLLCPQMRLCKCRWTESSRKTNFSVTALNQNLCCCCIVVLLLRAFLSSKIFLQRENVVVKGCSAKLCNKDNFTETGLVCSSAEIFHVKLKRVEMKTEINKQC